MCKEEITQRSEIRDLISWYVMQCKYYLKSEIWGSFFGVTSENEKLSLFIWKVEISGLQVGKAFSKYLDISNKFMMRWIE